MAQTRRGSHSRLSRTMRRMGLGRATVAAMACVVLMLGAAGIGIARQMGQSGIVVERSEDTAADADDAASSEREESSAEGTVAGQDAAADDSAPDGAEAAVGEGAQVSQAVEQPPTRYIVHVDGAVHTPGVIEMTGEDVRVADAIDAAGGLAEDADTSAINLAEPLLDGSKIHVPRIGEATTTSTYETQELAASPTSGSEASSGEAAAVSSGPININTATAEELQTLNGVGEATARAIIEEREANGPFASTEDIMRVSGIGEKKYAKIAGSICV